MLDRIIAYSINHKLIIILFSIAIVIFGSYSLTQISIGAVPDITNNQVQVLTTTRNLATEDVEKFITYPIELEMANLPGVKEIRSVSKFGLSVVTIVFDDEMGTYLPRQLIAEKIKSAEKIIPEGFGSPFMGPITTGLGEIYQYVLEVDPAYRNQYSLTDLRTIQDWIVKRQLSGIPGVVEVNTWGGYLKQYEVAVDPERLRSLQISVSDVFRALEQNNNVAGGGYIEKEFQTYFIRGEGLVGSLEDIEKIVVDNREGMPILIRDVATVQFGYATRFGAITGNGDGEKVLGQVMMLKGANSKAVIDAVKERVAEIQPSLPEGVSINPFLERSELIGKTTFTIAENLILGCLIVIFVVVLLLGNIRSGLVVASVIPMSLLFALTLMYLFDVDANLMSMGAIDFGIIIDGAVIIVEFIAFSITSKQKEYFALPETERQDFIDTLSFKGASKMMHSAIFGQLIIIIVFIPILSLVGVEGKMFKPMALVFCFALIGAIFLCFTYVPVMASIFIRPSDTSKKNISRRLITFMETRYQPTISWALRRKGVVLGLAASLLVMVGIIFTRMGGEFVPTLDEGDFVIQPVLKTGTSLSETVRTTTKIERILGEFPEVEQVVTRIGAAEVPTDPMGMEETDVIIKLAPKDTWTTVSTKDDLANAFKEALTRQIPGVGFEFTQPIEMRFNELITGVRADLAIKIFGEDLNILYRKGLEVEEKIRNVPGAADISVEKIDGLPQMTVKYNRNMIARYGLNIEMLNEIIRVGFAGIPAGTIFEGERQFDLVVRFDEDHRQNIDHIKNASIQLPNGSKLPLKEFAEITITKGPAKISRDETKRRIVIGVNVRNRDLESVVTDIQQIIQQEVSLPPGYVVNYGGQFENLRTARTRLMIAVPIALALIFIMLYFAFSSVKEALIIFSAIPLAAVGGVLLLYFRGMPFSISAGVGFIALFGIAVLNGIVLIEEFKELKAHGVKDINRRILIGTKKRLRPVLLTASAAALGFLPMAISTSAGAEVQRPLATVVMGGLVTATALTLIVLPLLYALFDSRSFKLKSGLKVGLLVIGLGGAFSGNAQDRSISVDEAIATAMENNQSLKAAEERVNQVHSLSGSAFDINKTELFFSYDENNIALNNQPIRVWGISQSLEFPTIYGAKRDVFDWQASMMTDQLDLQKRTITKEVSKAYYKVVFNRQLESNYTYLDSIFQKFATAAKRKFEQGETNYLEQLAAESKQREISIKLSKVSEDLNISQTELMNWLQTDTSVLVSMESMPRLEYVPLDSSGHPGLNYFQDAISMSQSQISLEKQKLLPDLSFSVFQGTNDGPNPRNYAGFQAGVALPLFFGSQRSRIQSARAASFVARAEAENYRINLLSEYKNLLAGLRQQQEEIRYYDEKGKMLAEELLVNATEAYNKGEIDFYQYIQLLENAKQIEENYLKALFRYNMLVLDINYLTL